MARNRQERLSASLKRSLYGPSLKPIESDYTMKEVNRMLTDLLGKPGVSAGKAQNALNSSISSGMNAGAYSSAQMDPSSAASTAAATTTSSGQGFDWISQGIGLIREVLSYVHADKAAAVAYDRQNEFYDNHMSMPAKVQEYQEAGLNPMGLAGGGVGATSAPSVQQGATPTSSAATEVLSALLNYKTNMAQIDVEKERNRIMGENVTSQIEYRSEQKIYQQKLNSYIDEMQSASLEKIQAENDLLRAQFDTEETKQALNRAGISLENAQAALVAQEALQKEFQNSPAYRQAELALQRAQANAQNASAAESYKNIKVMDKQIDVMDEQLHNVEADTALKWAQTAQGKQMLKNMGLEEKQLKFMIDHQQGDLIWKRVEQTVGMVKDVALGAGAVVAGATGLSGLTGAASAVSKTAAGMI